MAKSGSFNTSGYEGRDLTFSWSIKSQDVATNKTVINWSLKGAGSAQSSWYYAGNFKVVINGSTVYSSSDRIKLYDGTTVASGTATIAHNTDGSKTFRASAQAGIYTVAVNCTGSGSWSIDAIPRYPSVTQTLSSKTETSITMKWSSDSTIDYIWYSTDNGSTWTGINVTDGKSGSYTISGLSPNTTYKVVTSLRRKDSQLWKNSSPLSVTTYDYPYANSMPNFTIGNRLTLGIYNPLGREVTVNILGADGSQISHDVTTGTSITGYAGEVVVNRLYASIPNAKSGKYKVKVTYGEVSVLTLDGGTYSVNPNDCSPSIGSVAYQDINSTVTAITGNNQNIVRNHSLVRYIASSLTAQKSASVASCKVTVNGNTYDLTLNGSSASGGDASINSGQDVEATFTVTDSRGLTGTKTLTIKMLDWQLPTAIITIQRRNNYYSETDINVDADYSYVDGKNTISIAYKAKKQGTSSWTVTGTLQDNVSKMVTIDNTYAWDFQITLTDRFGGTTTYNVSVARGMPIAFFDRIRESVGVNCFPNYDRSLEVNGHSLFMHSGETLTLNQVPVSGFVTSSAKIANLLVPMGKSLANISTITVTACKGGIRTSEGGYLNGGSDSSNWLDTYGVTVTAIKVNDFMINLRIQSETAFTKVTNNTPLSLWCNPVTLAFS